MGNIVRSSGFELADKVREEVVKRLAGEVFDIVEVAVSFVKTSGLHYASLAQGIDRRCTIVNHPVGDGIRLVFGTREDFQFPSRAAKDSATTLDLGPTQFEKAAINIVYWLRGQDFEPE